MASWVRPDRISLPMMTSAAVTVRSLMAALPLALRADIASLRQDAIARSDRSCYQPIVDLCMTHGSVEDGMAAGERIEAGSGARSGWPWFRRCRGRVRGRGRHLSASRADQAPWRPWSGSRRAGCSPSDGGGLAGAAGTWPRTGHAQAGAPHYHGHRERLRPRSCEAARGLADYELLELLLFFSSIAATPSRSPRRC